MTKNKVSGLLGLATKAGKIVFGTEACIADIHKKKIKLLIVAEDAAERTKVKFEKICKENGIPVFEILQIEELSKAIGKENKAVVGIKDINFSNAILKLIDGGDVIG